jgi:uncharacterized repeat protein (TIGR03833 family)
MPISSRDLVYPGLPVSIVLKADQRTGRLTQGIVADVLTRHNHPRGIKVRLQGGAVGRIEAIRETTGQSKAPPLTQGHYPKPTHQQYSNRRNMSSQQSNNPWADQTSQGGYAANYYGQQQQQPPSEQQYQAPPGPPNQQQAFAPPARSQSDRFLPQGQERSEQVETMQNYESRAPKSDDDKAQEQLQKEFPNLDSSLIAAIYSDTKDVGQTREMLQELATTTTT